MKFCMHCGKEIKEKVKFCPFCGGEQKEVEIIIEEVESFEQVNSTNPEPTPIEEEPIQNWEQPKAQPIEEEPQQQSQQYNQQTEAQPTPLISINPDSVNQLADKSRNYLSYINNNIKNPTLNAQNNSGYFGLFTYFLINLILGISLSHGLGKAIHYENFKFEMFLPILILLLLPQFFNVLATYFLTTQIFNKKISLLDQFEQIYAPISITVYIGLAMFVLTFISTYGFSNIFAILLALSLFLINASYVANTWRAETFKPNRNRFYWTIGFMILSFIITIIAFTLLNDILDEKIRAALMRIFVDMNSNF